MTETQQDLASFEKLAQARESFLSEVGKVVIGQHEIFDHLLIALLAQGHSLIVGVPGLAKTLIIKTFLIEKRLISNMFLTDNYIVCIVFLNRLSFVLFH